MFIKELMRRVSTLCLLALVGFGAPALADDTSIAQSPLSTSSSNDVKPNILLVLDDSGSMGYDYMPDSVSSNDDDTCFGYSGYNKIFYDPDKTYTAPLYADGTSYADSSFTAAKTDGYSSSSGTVNLSTLSNLSTPSTVSTSTQTCTTNRRGQQTCSTTTTKTKFYYATYSGTSSSCDSNSAYTTVTSLSTAAEQTNYANWYSYYRTRILMARASVGFAFESLDDDYRVGFATIANLKSGASTSASSSFLDVSDFDSTQKSSFYSHIYGASVSGNTPLRAALSTAGQYFADKARNQTVDPMEYACQKNFTILTTDGYWNTGAETTTYGPYKLDNSTSVGNQDTADNGASRPELDDWKSTSTSSSGGGGGRSGGSSGSTSTTCGSGSTSGSVDGQVGGDGCSNTLADIAYYYANTDLRTSTLGNCTGVLGGDVCDNNPGDVTGVNTPQVMTTYTLGMGLSGELEYQDKYWNETSGDYYDIVQGNRPWPNPIDWSSTSRIDDLWHAAVNGGGRYYSASNATELADSLSSALSAIEAQNGSGGGAATSTLEPVSGDNYVYLASFTTVSWTGDLEAYTLDPDTGDIGTTVAWDAQTKLDSVDASSRTIYFGNDSGTLTSFTYANLNSTQQALFNNVGSNLSQYTDATSTVQTQANSGTYLVNYLRGDATYEGTAFRERDHKLGDIVDSSPVYVGAPPFSYADDGYSSFVSSNASRTAMVYVGANDGMLHAFNASTGAEVWAFVPSEVMQNMYMLADDDYSSNHHYFVDGQLTAVDVADSDGTWHTVLYGGLGAGGKEYFALDITTPSSPKLLWEFTDTDLGYSYGAPVVGKMSDGTWVAVFASGYNNNADGGDGNGHFFVLNAVTGAEVLEEETDDSSGSAVGTTTTPNGLAHLNGWVDSETDNTLSRIYGGDLLGNMWRFDINDEISPSGTEALLLGTATDDSGNAQPITTTPELAQITYSGVDYNIVMFGTGRMLGLADLTDDSTQSIYAIKDTLSTSGIGDLRSSGKLVEQVLSEATIDGETGLTITDNAVNWAEKYGWYVDFLTAGERLNVDMSLNYSVLTAASNIPLDTACVSGGESLLYYFDISTGSYVSGTDGLVGISLGNTLTVGVSTVQLTDGSVKTLVTSSDGTIKTEDAPGGSAGAGTLQRSTWRELITDQ